jgi:glucose dehydrogenase
MASFSSKSAATPMPGVPERDLVFLPTTSPSPDYYGGERRGQNLFANCVVALRASTGTMIRCRGDRR